jgi:hypothetical protein
LSVLLAAAAHAEPAATDQVPAEKPAAAKPAAKAKKTAKPAKKSAEKPAKPAQTAADKPADKAKSAASASAEPRVVAVDKLPKPLRDLHVCAMPQDKVELDSERYAKSVVFFISCPAARGKLTPTAVYVARDAKGTAAKRVMFAALAPDGGEAKLETLYSVTPAREAYTKQGDPQPHRHIKNDTPWLVGAWAPEDRPGVCAVAAQWRLQDDKAELYLWEEAKECPKDALPKYEAKADKKPPPLVGR